MKSLFTLLISCLLITSCSTQNKVSNKSPYPKKAKNIILFIGDGMGLTQITAGMYSNDNYTSLEEFPVVGLHKTHAYNDLVTDSAAGATAFSCGIKTYNGAIGVDPDTIPKETILEEAEKRGLATGLVATSSIVHATPASFFAHNRSRQNYEEIALDFLNTEVDYFVGGGLKFFNQRKSDSLNLLDSLKARNYSISSYFEKDFKKAKIPKEQNFAFLTAHDHPLTKSQGRDYLENASKKAVKYLDKRSEEGFFLMIEGSQIDWGGHANVGSYIISEMNEFQHVIKKVLDWAKKDGETLVIVTADHETGGFAIQQGSIPDSLVTGFTSTYHTATMIPVFAFGPGAEQFAGIYDNTAIYGKMRKAYGWKK
jgi:alkaline phosphatase